MERLTGRIDAVLRAIIVAVFVVLVICVVWQVFSRYVLASPSTFTDELARFLFMWTALLGAAYTLGQRRHLAIDLLSLRLTGRARMAVSLVVVAAVGGFALIVMLYGGGQLVYQTLSKGQISPALRFPMGYVYCAVPLAGAVILFYCVTFVPSVLAGGSGVNELLDGGDDGGDGADADPVS